MTQPTNKYELAAAIAVAKLDTFSGKLTAKQQREVFGAAVFGKKDITINSNGQGSVRVGYWARLDYVTTDVSFEDLVKKIAVYNETGYIGW